MSSQTEPSQHSHSEEIKIDLPPLPTRQVMLVGIAFAVLFAILFVVGWWPHHVRMNAAAQEAGNRLDARPVVAVATPHPATVAPALTLPGDVKAFQSTDIFPRSNGYIKTLKVDIGDKVKEGDLLAEIEAPEIDAQLAAARATLEQAQASASRARDDFELAQTTLERYENFSKSGGVTQQQLDEKRSALTNAKSALAGAAATVRADQAEVQRLEALQGFKKIVAPFSGTVTSRNYDIGALVSASTTGDGKELFHIDDTDTLRVFVNVPQNVADQVKIGSPAQFVVRNWPDAPFIGKIARTAGSIDAASRTLRIEVDFPNPDGKLLPGMYGTLRYEFKQKSPPLVVPSSALVFGPEGMQLAIVGDDNKIAFKKVSLGQDLGTEVEVVSGLNGNEQIVANPGQRLVNGVEVEVRSPLGAKPAVAETPTTKPAKLVEALAR